jgi:tetrahydromethanopterin S-methyltransferase subunit G
VFSSVRALANGVGVALAARYPFKDGVMATTDMILPLLTRMRDDMNARFDAMDKRFDAMDKRFDAMDKRFDAMDKRFDALEGRVEHVEHHAVVANSKLDTVMARLAHVEVVCEQGWAQVSANATFASKFELRYTSDLAEIRSRLDRLEGKDPPTRP